MKKLESKLFCIIAILLIAAASAAAQNRFEGYSLTVEADESGTCPVKYKPQGSNYVDVVYAGTKRLASDVVACPGSGTTVNLGRVTPNGDGRWCFEGSQDFYEIELQGAVRYIWHPTNKNTGFFNVKDFRPVVRGVVTEPADYTKTIKNAVAFIASRQGGTLYFPEGDYIVGTTNGTIRNPSYNGIALPSGIVIQGASPNASIPTTNLPMKRSPTSIRLRHPNQPIFRISGCTNHVTIKNVELLGNSAGWQEPPRDSTGNYGIEAMGKWEVDPTTGADTPNSSQFFKFENITFQNLDRAIYVHNANDVSQTCNPAAQRCSEWQFDYVKVDHGIFINNKAGIWINTYNTDWKVTNSLFNYVAPGEGIHLQKGGSMLIEQTFGAGYDFAANIGGPFINIDTFGTLTIINSSTERGQKSIYTNPAGAISTLMLVVVGSHFGDKIELNGRLNYISTGNYYGAKTVTAGPNVKITSTGDRFCYDPAVLPGYCRDENNQPVTNPGFNGGKVMFQTGRPAEGSGANLIQRRPNFFGYDVEIHDDDHTNNEPLLFARSQNFDKALLRLGQSNFWYDFRRDERTGFLNVTGNQDKPYVGITINGLVQMDKNTTFNDLIVYGTTISSGQPLITDGAIVYCKDCAKNAAGVCIQGTAGVDGAFAKRINNTWRCD
ncbi:MAG: hypothetical protein M3384_14170 [Acidobacteriota bacterium]|nr:hypothetical protein [Acidobacteriota bacterium]